MHLIKKVLENININFISEIKSKTWKPIYVKAGAFYYFFSETVESRNTVESRKIMNYLSVSNLLDN